LHHVRASQRYIKSAVTLVINKGLLLINLLGDQSTILSDCFKILD
jgi:hypothetical protein